MVSALDRFSSWKEGREEARAAECGRTRRLRAGHHDFERAMCTRRPAVGEKGCLAGLRIRNVLGGGKAWKRGALGGSWVQ